MAIVGRIRVKLAAGLMLGVAALLTGAQAHASAPTATRYACEGRQNLLIQRDAKTARVEFIDGSYQLERKASGVGVKYASPSATLIIDGPSAIFVAGDRLQLGACTESMHVASRQ